MYYTMIHYSRFEGFKGREEALGTLGHRHTTILHYSRYVDAKHRKAALSIRTHRDSRTWIILQSLLSRLCAGDESTLLQIINRRVGLLVPRAVKPSLGTRAQIVTINLYSSNKETKFAVPVLHLDCCTLRKYA